ncbi:SPFH domain-containing protein [Nocardia tenerifensis]|uniref:SPFH domain-containing protein n=1 Tax=Nocardia tenerifensis TaxID=228006 RepID=A0A318JWH7_9NOCA|nr:SPFH domain-containing protein [Nocardia tenerifensis]
MDILAIVVGIVGLGGVLTAASARVVAQYEKALIFRFGRVVGTRDPGLRMLVPFIDRMRKVSTQIVTMPVPAQEGITRDNVTVRVDAVVYFRVIDPVLAVVEVQNYLFAVGQVAQTSLRSIIGKSDLDALLSNREELNKGLEIMIDSPALGWGVHIDRVEIKDVALPDSLKRSMSRQAEAERERRARVISAEGELQASQMLAQAGAQMSESPAALQLRLLETVVQVAAEKNSTLVLPFPVELLRFLERATPQSRTPEKSDEHAAVADRSTAAADERAAFTEKSMAAADERAAITEKSTAAADKPAAVTEKPSTFEISAAGEPAAIPASPAQRELDSPQESPTVTENGTRT